MEKKGVGRGGGPLKNGKKKNKRKKEMRREKRKERRGDGSLNVGVWVREREGGVVGEGMGEEREKKEKKI